MCQPARGSQMCSSSVRAAAPQQCPMCHPGAACPTVSAHPWAGIARVLVSHYCGVFSVPWLPQAPMLPGQAFGCSGDKPTCIWWGSQGLSWEEHPGVHELPYGCSSGASARPRAKHGGTTNRMHPNTFAASTQPLAHTDTHPQPQQVWCSPSIEGGGGPLLSLSSGACLSLLPAAA